MSLIMAFSGILGAFMAGDQREILFRGEASSIAILETEFYCNRICTVEQLQTRASALGVSIAIRDDKCKVRQEDGLLIGEVTETDGAEIRKRRLCVSCGQYAIVEKTGPAWTILSRGEGSHFLVLGNETTRNIAYRCIREHWKTGGGTLEDAVKILLLAMQEAARTTASVSREYTLVQTRTKVNVLDRLDR
ncbi:MAG: DUF2121 domain-containing protein [Methanolinea sp.]|nr:DUF2121 domain-containing protein [Methanolinea sp.]